MHPPTPPSGAPKPSMLNIACFKYSDLTVFGIRGFGDDYLRLYKELPRYEPVEVGSSPRWHYLRFGDKLLEEKFLEGPLAKPYLYDEEVGTEGPFNRGDLA